MPRCARWNHGDDVNKNITNVHIANEKQYFCTLRTSVFHFCTFCCLSTTWNNLFCSCVYNVTTCRCSIHSLFFFFTLLLFASLLFINLVFLFVWHLVVCTHWKANTNFKTNLSVLEIQPSWTLLTNCSCSPPPPTILWQMNLLLFWVTGVLTTW